MFKFYSTQNKSPLLMQQKSFIFKNPPMGSLDPEIGWNQWLAGLIDGDGCFYISKTKQVSLEITTALLDERMLQEIKQRIGGAVKKRAGSQSVRLRVGKREQVLEVVKRVNGYIRLESRYQQFQAACHLLHVKCLLPEPLVLPNGYLSGLFDADGSVTISVMRTKGYLSTLTGVYGMYERLAAARGYHQLSLHIVSKDRAFIHQIHMAAGFGAVCSDHLKGKRPNTLYRWYFRSHEDVAQWLNIIQTHPLRSVKKQRCALLPSYFELRRSKAHLAERDSANYKTWLNFSKRWFNL